MNLLQPACSDFNFYHKVWFGYSNKTDEEGRYCRSFSITYQLTQIIEELTQVWNTMGQLVNLLDLFLITCPDKCSAKVLLSIGMSDHSLVSIQIDSKSMTSLDLPFHRMFFLNAKANLYSLQSYMTEALFPKPSLNMLPSKLLP